MCLPCLRHWVGSGRASTPWADLTDAGHYKASQTATQSIPSTTSLALRCRPCGELSLGGPFRVYPFLGKGLSHFLPQSALGTGSVGGNVLGSNFSEPGEPGQYQANPEAKVSLWDGNVSLLFRGAGGAGALGVSSSSQCVALSGSVRGQSPFSSLLSHIPFSWKPLEDSAHRPQSPFHPYIPHLSCPGCHLCWLEAGCFRQVVTWLREW